MRYPEGVSEDAEHFLTSLHVHNAFAVRDLEIPIATEGQRRHLLLTGPNGSGKSSILAGLHRELLALPNSPSQSLDAFQRQAHSLEGALASAGAELARAKFRHALDTTNAQLRALETEPVVAARGLGPSIDPKQLIVSLIGASRTLELQRPAGPNRLDEQRYLHLDGGASMLLQFLVNLRTEQAYAREDGDDDTADGIGGRFDHFEQRLRELLDDPKAQLHFDRSSFDFGIELADGRRIGFDQLPDGVSSILYMWASMMIPAEALRRSGVADPPGWVLIDEPELHLHVHLQERILPFLTAMFPNVQLIVATNSPVVLANLPDATIFDLRARTAIDSTELEGTRYGTILEQHFGIESEFDLETTRKLRRLKELSDAVPDPGTPQHDEFRELAQALSDLPHPLVTQLNGQLDIA